MSKKPQHRKKTTREKKRAKNRQHEKVLKNRLTEDQYKDLREGVIDDMVQERVERNIKKIFTVVLKELRGTLRNNRVSEDRTDKVIREFADRFETEFKKEWGEDDEGLPESK